MKRPATAEDCPGCKVGWIWGEILCPRCKAKVNKAQLSFYTEWLAARQSRVDHERNVLAVDAEAYHRGLIIGTAMALHAPKGSGQSWEYRITPKCYRALKNAKKKAS